MTAARKSLSVLTLNVWNREGPWEQRLALLHHWLGVLQPDLIGLQEVLGQSHLDEILGARGYHTAWYGETSGIAIAARWPLTERAEHALPVDDQPGGLALRAMVQSPYGAIPFTCATTAHYLTHMGFKREQQMPALNDFARGRSRTDFPAILVGDFNTDPESAEVRYLKGYQSLGGRSAYWCDAWDQAGDAGKGYTWSRSNTQAAWAPWPNRRIDYIFVAQPRADHAGTVETCRIACNEARDGVYPSDHFGVFATLQTA